MSCCCWAKLSAGSTAVLGYTARKAEKLQLSKRQSSKQLATPPLSLSLSLLPAYPVNNHLLMPVYFLAVYAAACYLFARRSRPSWPTLKSNFNDQCTRLHIRLAYMPIINNARCHAHPPQPFSARPCVDINEL